ncbi:MAG TPA: thioredoxin family protein [Phnomibacter sp.]|nr:thioredoxin family protein [Phnomibacter sp.]
MKKYITIIFALVGLFAKAQVTTIAVGNAAPDFKLKNVDNKEISFASYPKANGFIVVFTCNTCPVSKAYEQRIIDLNKKYAPLGYPVIAINPNDPEVSKGDSFEKMQELANEKKYAFSYLFDEGQVITNLYGAKSTPHVFVVSKTKKGNIIEYTGAIDNDREETNATSTKYVEQVITALSKNEKPAVTATKAIGCTVKRKATN